MALHTLENNSCIGVSMSACDFTVVLLSHSVHVTHSECRGQALLKKGKNSEITQIAKHV